MLIPAEIPALLPRSPLDHLEARQRAVSDELLVLERRRQSLLLRPDAEAEIVRIRRRSACLGRILGDLDGNERQMIAGALAAVR